MYLDNRFDNLIDINDLNDIIKTYKMFGFTLDRVFKDNAVQFIKSNDGIACYILTIEGTRIQLYYEATDKIIFDNTNMSFKELTEELLKI